MATNKRIQINGQYYYENSIDLNNLINDTLGSDFVNYISDLKNEADYTLQSIDTDLNCFEMQVQTLTSALLEVLETTENLTNKVETTKRMNKSKILDTLNSIIKLINNEI